MKLFLQFSIGIIFTIFTCSFAVSQDTLALQDFVYAIVENDTIRERLRRTSPNGDIFLHSNRLIQSHFGLDPAKTEKLYLNGCVVHITNEANLAYDGIHNYLEIRSISKINDTILLTTYTMVQELNRFGSYHGTTKFVQKGEKWISETTIGSNSNQGDLIEDKMIRREERYWIKNE